jgi:hypothetical protein
VIISFLLWKNTGGRIISSSLPGRKRDKNAGSPDESYDEKRRRPAAPVGFDKLIMQKTNGLSISAGQLPVHHFGQEDIPPSDADRIIQQRQERLPVFT